jgi:hypothetical protein
LTPITAGGVSPGIDNPDTVLIVSMAGVGTRGNGAHRVNSGDREAMVVNFFGHRFNRKTRSAGKRAR